MVGKTTVSVTFNEEFEGKHNTVSTHVITFNLYLSDVKSLYSL